MKYSAWTYTDVRDRVIEASETLMATPAALGPRMTSGSMAEVVREMQEGYGYDGPRIKRVPPPGAIARMEETWGWINAWLDEKQRKKIYDYTFIKTRKGLYLNRYLANNDVSRRTFERQIRKYCQIIADNLNRNRRVRFTMKLDGLSQNSIEADADKVSSVKYAKHWRAPGAKPKHLPDRPPPRRRSIKGNSRKRAG